MTNDSCLSLELLSFEFDDALRTYGRDEVDVEEIFRDAAPLFETL